MRRVVVELKVMIQDGKGGMVEFEEVLQRPAFLAGGNLDVVDVDGRNPDGRASISRLAKPELGNRERGEGGKHGLGLFRT